jgi:Kef-type K+ transport system membrane component KefB
MPASSFTGLAIVAAVAFAVPLLLGLAPRLRLPGVVAEIVAGIVIGPSGLHWVRVDAPITVLSTLGLAFLLFLAGLEIDLTRLRGRVLLSTGLAFLVSLLLAFSLCVGFGALGTVQSPLLVAIILAATALGIVLPVLQDAGEAASPFGQLVIAGATMTEFGTILLLSLLFSRAAHSIGARLVLLAAFALLAGALALAIWGAERLRGLSDVLRRLQDRTDQLRTRRAYLAGALLALVDRDQMVTHPRFRTKLEAIAFGVFVPFFVVASGLRFDLTALTTSPATLVRAPVFLAALLLVRGAPALLYRPLVGGRRTVAAALLQATSLTFIVPATQIGRAMGLMSAATAAAFVAAGRLSVLLFPFVALTVLRRAEQPMIGPPVVALPHQSPAQSDT